MKSEERDKFDRLLDSALSSYVAAEPRTGLERRVLQHVKAEGGSRRPRWLTRLVPSMALACLFVLVSVFWVARKSESNMPQLAPIADFGPKKRVPRAKVAENRTPRRTLVERVIHRRVTLGNLPKQEQFPSPAPLTAEERELLRLAKYNRDEIPAPLISPPQPTETIQIAEIQIKPLPDSGTRKGEHQ